MKKILFTCAAAVLGAGLMGPAFAQTEPMSQQSPSTQQSPATQPMPGQQTPGADSSMQSNGMSAQQDLTGQTIYSSKGHKIGTVSQMTTNAQGERVAVVEAGKFLGLGGKDIEVPVNSLQQRSAGGYKTTLSNAEIKKLPTTSEAGESHSSTTPHP